MFIAAPFTIARTRKQPKCPPRDDYISIIWNLCTMEHYSAIKGNEVLTTCYNSRYFET